MRAEQNTEAPPRDWCPEIGASPSNIKWPVVPATGAAQLLAGLYQLDRSQWWPPERLLHEQFKQLHGVLRHAWITSPWHRARLVAAGLDLSRPLDRESWRRIPILTRSELQLGGTALLSSHVPHDHGGMTWTQTSGSTGQPVKVARTGLTDFFWRIFALRHDQWHRRDLSGKLAAIRYVPNAAAPPPEGIVMPDWGAAARGLFHTGPSCALNIDANVSDQAAWLLRHNPDYLLTYPSNLLALTTHFRQHGLTLPRLKEVQAVAEIVTPSVRQACRDAWGVPLVDMYTSQEFGWIALQCPQHEHYHVQAENVLVEVLDEHGDDCAPGRTGRLVISSLHNFAMPLIRYEIGDHAEAGGACACGRGLPVLNRILGRTRNMLKLPGGEQRWPLMGFRQFREIAPIQQFQFIQKSFTQLHARFVVERSLTPEQEHQLQEHIRKSLGHPFEISCEYLDSIPRGKTGKYEEFLVVID